MCNIFLQFNATWKSSNSNNSYFTGSFSFNYYSLSTPTTLRLLFLDCIRNPRDKGTMENMDSCSQFILAHQLWLLTHSLPHLGTLNWYQVHKTFTSKENLRVPITKELERCSLLGAKVPSLQLKLWEVLCRNVESTSTSTPSQISLRH